MRRSTLFAVVVTTIALVGPVPAANAQEALTVWTGQGTDNGVCSSIEDGFAPPGRQIWQFNLNPIGEPRADARLNATFDDGTTVVNQPPDNIPGMGSVVHFFVETDLDAILLTASATHHPPDQGNTGLRVSHCVQGEPNGEPPNGEPPNGEPPNGEPPNGEPPNGVPPNGEPPDGKPREMPPDTKPPEVQPKPAPAPVTPTPAPAPAARPVPGEPAFTG